MERPSSAISTSTLSVHTRNVTQVLGISDDVVKPFQLGLSVFGAMAFFLAGLIRTSLPYFYWDRRPSLPDRAERRCSHA